MKGRGSACFRKEKLLQRHDEARTLYERAATERRCRWRIESWQTSLSLCFWGHFVAASRSVDDPGDVIGSRRAWRTCWDSSQSILVGVSPEPRSLEEEAFGLGEPIRTLWVVRAHRWIAKIDPLAPLAAHGASLVLSWRKPVGRGASSHPTGRGPVDDGSLTFVSRSSRVSGAGRLKGALAWRSTVLTRQRLGCARRCVGCACTLQPGRRCDDPRTPPGGIPIAPFEDTGDSSG